MIKTKNFIEIEDFTQEISEKHGISLNEAWILLYNVVGKYTMEDVDLMVDDGYAPEAWGWLKGFMIKNNMNKIIVKSRDEC